MPAARGWEFDSLPEDGVMPASFVELTLTAAAWVGIAAAAVLVAALAVALMRKRLVAALTLVALLGFGAFATQSWESYRRDGERRALQSRLLAIETAAWNAGSPLSCLGVAEPRLTEACERALFASPQSVAAALSFTAARIGWLEEADALLRRDASFDAAASELRTAIEQDRYGVVAHVLQQRYGCSADVCAPLARLRNKERVRANLRDNAFAKRIEIHQADWEKAPPEEPAASVAAVSEPKGTPLPPKYTLPSADSIPPVSIMNPEPGTGAGAAAPSASGLPAPPATTTGSRAPALPPPAPAAGASRSSRAAPPPLQIGPATRP